jgi:hypothetical protein
MRNAFVDELILRAEQDESIVLVVGDLGYGVVEPFARRFPKRYFNAGVAEQNMMGLSAGLASEGFHVFVYSIANFPTFRCAEQIRNDIDYYLRRYHEYCIQQRDGMKAHYHEVGADDDCDFEHLIPAARIRDLLLASAISVEQSLNAPTVRLSRTKHMALKDAGWASKTPNMWLPFERYTNVFQAEYITHDSTAVDPLTWTLEKHYNYFKHLVI